MQPRFFKTPAALRKWLKQNHNKAGELLVGFYKTHTGRPSVTYHQALDEALCFGWIDGVRKRIDEEAYTIRFTPRKPGSYWSLINIKRATALIEQGRMQPAGLKEFEARDEKRARRYSNEARTTGLSAAYEKQLRANKKAWAFWQAQPPSYRKPVSWWVMSAKKEETRQRRLATLIDDSAHGRRIALMTKWAKK